MVSRAAHLILEAKQAIADEQLQRFLKLQRQGRWEEAAIQLGTTLALVSNLLDEGAEALLALDPLGNQRPENVQQESQASLPAGTHYLEDEGRTGRHKVAHVNHESKETRL
jgi:hypothetical protein